ncbi:MAG: hypothetical protein LUD41_01210 [Phascolarctobacterium sp.]|nr:hypothetical protein [Phascolarctobacterium sp.]
MESQQSLFAENAQSVVSVQKQAAAFDPFGCCGRYAECSNAGACVNPIEEMRVSCAYQKKLSQGVIFYGKNATNFNRARYDSYADAINILTAGERVVLSSLFHLSFAEQCGTYRAFFGRPLAGGRGLKYQFGKLSDIDMIPLK